jgi:hypothetical protein
LFYTHLHSLRVCSPTFLFQNIVDCVPMMFFEYIMTMNAQCHGSLRVSKNMKLQKKKK